MTVLTEEIVEAEITYSPQTMHEILKKLEQKHARQFNVFVLLTILVKLEKRGLAVLSK